MKWPAVLLPALWIAFTPKVAANPPSGSYATWLAHHFPATYGDPALEATVWGDNADPDGDRCPNIIEFMMARDPNVQDSPLGPRCRIDGNDFVVTYRETTTTNHGITWLGEWSTDFKWWTFAGVRYEVIESYPEYYLIEARISRNREARIFFRLVARK